MLGPAHFKHAGAGLSAAGLSALDHLLGWRVHFCLKDVFASLENLDSGQLPPADVRNFISASSTQSGTRDFSFPHSIWDT